MDGRLRSEQPLVVLINVDHRLGNKVADHLRTDQSQNLANSHLTTCIYQAANRLCDRETQLEDC